MNPMPWWKRWPNRARLALVGLKYRFARLLHRLGVLPELARASTDTMGDWKRLQATPDDPPPGLRRPPAGPYADIIRRVRLYAQNGAKALGPLLDSPLPVLTEGDEEFVVRDERGAPVLDWDAASRVLDEIYAASGPSDFEGGSIARAILCAGIDEEPQEALRAIHAAYNSPWTVVDGEVYEVVVEKEREGVQ